MRRWSALVATVALVAGLVVWPAPAANALPIPDPGCVVSPITCIPGVPSLPKIDSCKTPPSPVSPGTGPSSVFDGDPAPVAAGAAPSSLYERYGYGPHWSIFDTGCAPNVGATVDNVIGNLLYGAATGIVAVGNGVHRLVANPTWLRAFDTLETNVTTGLHQRIYLVFLPASLLILALLIAARASKQDMHGTLRTAGWALFVMLLVTWVASYPIRAGRAADSIETDTVNAISSALAGSGNSGPSAAGTLEVQSVLYPAWLQGELGKSTGATADKFGQRLWDAQAFTWDEAKDPAKYTSKKQTAFADMAGQIHDQDIGAYRYLKGEADYGRMGAGFFAAAGAVLTVPFRMVADLLVVASLLLIRIAVMFAPILAVIGIHRRASGLVRGTLSALAAALINAVVFSAGAGVFTYATGVLLSPASGVPQWAGLVLSGLLMLLFWVALRPVRRLTQMLPASHSPVHHAAGESRATIHKVGGLATDAAVGVASGKWAAAAYRRARDARDLDGYGEEGTTWGMPRREALGDTEPLTPPATPTAGQIGDQRPASNGNGTTARTESTANTWEDIDPLAPGAEPAPAEVAESADPEQVGESA